jgi:hypothetical protein
MTLLATIIDFLAPGLIMGSIIILGAVLPLALLAYLLRRIDR